MTAAGSPYPGLASAAERATDGDARLPVSHAGNAGTHRRTT